MGVKVEMKNDVTICYIDGEIDINTSPDIKKAFDKVLSKKTAKILINLIKVTYVDSSGLATLVEVLKNMRAYGGKMRLAGKQLIGQGHDPRLGPVNDGLRARRAEAGVQRRPVGRHIHRLHPANTVALQRQKQRHEIAARPF